ncbi:hypothetical protein GT037_004149 [Alternaria burnsii]|uniref:BTB domain-containing protein n=1 Tax=Alternaria burnsii TaxID=1187904 RepID=A0A8H7EG14_9PLEO|nr:uncharacterized protein GT037_004149 [Alternaria burnsii]KAF7677290.1 hypothetical protein GT037_004149 [Alternaria burnsii]
MAKRCKRATKAASVAAPRPVTSPYTSPTVTLHFGPTLQEYYLPDTLLQQLEKIPSRDPWTGKIHLADVDASIGHVLIHFLHTGVYQTLNDESIGNTKNTQQDIVLNEFQTALLTLEVAKKYGVPGLQDLAQVELERRGEDMCLRDAVRVIREDLIVGPSGEHAWLRDYVSMKVRSAFKHDPSAILAPDFFDNIESPTLTKLVAQITVGLLSEEIDKLRKEKTATGRISAPEHDELQGPCSPDIADLPSKCATQGPNAWPTSVQKFGAFDDSSAAWGPHRLAQDGSRGQEADAPAALPSSIEEDSHATERIDAESWGLDEDKVETQHLRVEQATIAQSQEGDDATANSTVTKYEDDGAEVQPLRSIWGSLGKKKKKSKANISYQPAPVSPPNIQVEVDPTLVVSDIDTIAPDVPGAQERLETERDPYAGLTKSQVKKLKARLYQEAKSNEEEEEKRQREEEVAAEIRQQGEQEQERRLLEEEEQRIQEEEEADLRRIEEEEAAAAAAEAEAEAEICKKREEQETQPRDAFPAAPLEKTKNKKIKRTEQMGLEDWEANTKKIEGEDVTAADTRAETCPTKDDDPWDDWGPAASITEKKKKSRKPKDLTLAEDEENERIRQEEENAAVATTTADLSAVGSTGATFGDDDCKLRVEHLSQNCGWQNCEPCVLYMRKIAMKLHSKGLPIEDGFNTIN